MKTPDQIIKTEKNIKKEFLPIKSIDELETVKDPPDYYSYAIKKPGLLRILTDEELKKFDECYPLNTDSNK